MPDDIFRLSAEQAFEAALHDAGFRIAERQLIDGEWREWREEEGDRHTSRQMLRIARMLRSRDSLIARVDRKDYEIELAACTDSRGRPWIACRPGHSYCNATTLASECELGGIERSGFLS